MKAVKSWGGAAVVFFFFLMFLCPGAHAAKTLTVAVDGDWPPMKMKDAQGNLTGFEIDVLKAVAGQADFETTIVEIPWKDLFGALNSGKVDIVVASVSVTDKRKKEYDFSLPYYKVEQLLVVQKSRLFKPMKGATVAAFGSTTGETALRKSEIVTAKIYPVAEMEKPFRDLADGTIDGVLCDSPVAVSFAFLNTAYKNKFAIESEESALGKASPVEEYAIMVKKGNKAVLDLVNSGIKAANEKNILTKIKMKWFSG